MIFRPLQNLWRELNNFLSSTSVHGLPYIHRSQSRTTRIIWTVLVAAALTTATVFLVQTVRDWDTKYISTTVETRGVENYPFPAVTFHPGEFPTRRNFLRTFLNHFQLTRYEESSPLFENSVFMDKYSILVQYFAPGSSSLFDWVPDYLLKTEKTFIQRFQTPFRNEVCQMLSLKNKNKSLYKKTRKEIIKQFNENMFKYSGYQGVLGFSRKTFNSMIKDGVAGENITNKEIETACQKKQNEDDKKEIAALLLSFLYVFIDVTTVKDLGPGDIAGEEYFHLWYDLHTLMTRMFNDLTNASLASPVVFLPDWFSLSPLTVSVLYLNRDALPPTISEFTLQRYQDFWTEYNNHRDKITFVCRVKPCTEEQDFYLDQKSNINDLNSKIAVRQADLLSAPCSDINLAKQFNFRESVI